MIYVYLLKSLKDVSYYSGITKNLENRLKKHNRGEVSYTKNHKPYMIVWYDQTKDYKDARRIERWLKKRSLKEKEDLCRANPFGG